MTTHIGIDLSINSTAITMIRGDQMSMFSIVPNYKKGKASFKIHENLYPHVTILTYDKFDRCKEDYVIDQNQKIQSALNLSTIIESMDFGREPNIYLEGFSYMSSGSSFIDLILYNAFTRKALFEKYGNITVQAPSAVKKFFTGAGNANKSKMVAKFCELDLDVAKQMKSYVDWTVAKPNIPKPIDDIVDSFALASMSLAEEQNSK